MKIALMSFVLMINFTDSLSQEIRLEFIAMQYYAGILNRSYVVQVSDSLIFCGRVQGAIAAGVSGRYDKSRLEDPYFYANPYLLAAYHSENVSKKIELILLGKPDIENIIDKLRIKI
jgi:hypothetical protein